MANTNFYSVELRDNLGNLKQYITPWVSRLSWEWNRIGGCGRCSVTIKKGYRDIQITPGDDIQIRLRSGSITKLMYRGWVASPTPKIAADENTTLDIKGYFDRLNNIIVQDDWDKKTYNNMSIDTIVESIVDTYITPNSSITKGTIDTANFSADTLQFKCSVIETLRTLSELEGNIEYGVDENLVFFWRTESDTLRKKFFVGNDIESFEIKTDLNQLVNKVYFEGGKVDDVLFLLSGGATDSQGRYFIAEGLLNNSSIISLSVAEQYINQYLQEKAKATVILRVKILNTTLRLEDTLPIGKIAVHDANYDQGLFLWGTTANGGDNILWGKTRNGGSNGIWGSIFKDQIDRIGYSLSETEERFNLEITTGGSLLETAAKIKQIELLLSNIRQQ